MGIPLPRPEPELLPLFKGFFVAAPTPNLVGSYAPDTFVAHQRQGAAAAFVPLVSIAGGLLRPAWAGQRLAWVYGALHEDGAFFRVHSGGQGQLEYLGTARHPSPDWLDFAGAAEARRGDRLVSPGFIDYVEQEGCEDSDDPEGFHDAPAVLVGGEPALPADDRPACLRCRGPMHYVGCVDTELFSDDLPEDVSVCLFYCEDCRIQCCREHDRNPD